MIKHFFKFITFAILISLGIGSNNLVAQSFTINIEIDQFPKKAKEKVFLYQYSVNNYTIIDSLAFNKRGKALFTIDSVKTPGLFLVNIPNKARRSVILNPQEKGIILTADYTNLKETGLSVKDSKENEAFATLLNTVAQNNQKLKQIQTSYQVMSIDSFANRKREAFEDFFSNQVSKNNTNIQQLIQTYKETFVAQVYAPMYLTPQMSEYPTVSQNYDNLKAFLHDHYLDFVDFKNQAVLTTPRFDEVIDIYLFNYCEFSDLGFQRSVDNLMKRAVENVVVYNRVLNHLIQFLDDQNLDKYMAYVIQKYVQGNEKYLSKANLQSLQGYLGTIPGTKIKSFIAMAPDGNQFSIEQIAELSKYTLLTFWTPNMPGLEKMQGDLSRVNESLKDKGLNVLDFCITDNKQLWIKEIKKVDNWGHITDLKGVKSETVAKLRITNVPHSMLIDQKGNILFVNPSLKDISSLFQ